MRELKERCEQLLGAPLPHLSMGMTGDFEVAIEEGAPWFASAPRCSARGPRPGPIRILPEGRRPKCFWLHFPRGLPLRVAVTTELFSPEIAEAMKAYEKYVICIDKTPEEFEASLTSLLNKAIKAYEGRGRISATASPSTSTSPSF